MRKISILLLLLVGFLLTSLPGTSRAQSCGSLQLLIQGPSSLTVNNLQPVGTVIASATYSWPHSSPGCGSVMGADTAQSTYPYLGNHIYATGIAGIGIRISQYGTCAGVYQNMVLPWTCVSSSGGYNLNSLNAGNFTVEFVKTGTILGSGVLSGAWGNFAVGSTIYANFYWASPIYVYPNNPTCMVAPGSSQTVQMGTVPDTAFGAIGSTAGGNSFSISLNCTAGTVGQVANVYVTLADQSNPGNTSNALSLVPGTGVATGVGIQISNSSGVVSYGPDNQTTTGGQGQWLVATTNGSNVTIPLTARYVKTAAVITGGKANAVATFTFAYN